MRSFYLVRHKDGSSSVVSESPAANQPGIDWSWDEDQRRWVKDGYVMLLAADYVRRERNTLLKPVLDVLERHLNQKSFDLATTLTDVEAREVALYAQALRDVPSQTGFPYEVIWPIRPIALDITRSRSTS